MVGPKSLSLGHGYDLAECTGAFHALTVMYDALGSAGGTYSYDVYKMGGPAAAN